MRWNILVPYSKVTFGGSARREEAKLEGSIFGGQGCSIVCEGLRVGKRVESKGSGGVEDEEKGRSEDGEARRKVHVKGRKEKEGLCFFFCEVLKKEEGVGGR